MFHGARALRGCARAIGKAQPSGDASQRDGEDYAAALVCVKEHMDEDGTCIITMDDGKVNAFSEEAIGLVHAHLDEALASKAKAVVVTGNDKVFSAGFDLSVMGGGPSPEAAQLLKNGAELCLRFADFPRPVIFATKGHALALGGILMFCADLRIGPSDVPGAKFGMNEVAIGIPVPAFALELARWRLAPPYLTRSTVLASLYDADEAMQAGYLDTLVPADAVVDTAMTYASEYGKFKTQHLHTQV